MEYRNDNYSISPIDIKMPDIWGKILDKKILPEDISKRQKEELHCWLSYLYLRNKYSGLETDFVVQLAKDYLGLTFDKLDSIPEKEPTAQPKAVDIDALVDNLTGIGYRASKSLPNYEEYYPNVSKTFRDILTKALHPTKKDTN